MSDMAKKDVLMYVTKYGFEYVLSANMYCLRQLRPMWWEDNDIRWPRNLNLSTRRQSQEGEIFPMFAEPHFANQRLP
jgi:hypothetical protein